MEAPAREEKNAPGSARVRSVERQERLQAEGEEEHAELHKSCVFVAHSLAELRLRCEAGHWHTRGFKLQSAVARARAEVRAAETRECPRRVVLEASAGGMLGRADGMQNRASQRRRETRGRQKETEGERGGQS
eukprot:162500-Rhodomonas_salina.1